MDSVKAVRDYITKMISDTPGMKVMLLDKETTSIVSMAYTQSEILQKEVYLLERIDNAGREVMTHLKAIVFLRPTQTSIDALVAELKRPKYGQYDIYFSNILKPTQLERLAEADEHELVREVQEYFADYLAIGPNLITFNLIGVVGDTPNVWKKAEFDRVHQGLIALLLSLRKRPILRYQESSELCHKLAHQIGLTVQKEASLFDFRQAQDTPPPILLVLDRRDDPVTPLLNQWTYQAMVHELLGIKNNRVDLSTVPNVSKDLKEIVLASDQDEFYARNMYLNFGDIGQNIRTLVDEFQAKTKSHEKMESIADMKEFVESYPQFRAMSGSVSKHVSVVGELSRQVDAFNLLGLSEVEQDLVCQGQHSAMVQDIRRLLADAQVRPKDKARLVMLYALRYGGHSSSVFGDLVQNLSDIGIDSKLIQTVRAIKAYAGDGAHGRLTDLWGSKGVSGFVKKMTGGLKGVENIYTQHVPLLSNTLDQLAKGKLKDSGVGSFPCIDAVYKERPQDIIIFIVGGCTYAEAKTISEFNENNPSMRAILAGTSLLNFSSYAAEINNAARM